MTTLIDFCIYFFLTLWAIAKCVFLGGLLVSPVVFVWAMLISAKRADEIMEEHARGVQKSRRLH